MITRGRGSGRTPSGDVLPRSVPGSAPPGAESIEAQMGVRNQASKGRFRHIIVPCAEKKISVNRCAKTVKDRKISKTDLYSYYSEAEPVRQFNEVARAICSQEHLPSFLFFGHYAKTV